MLEVLKDKNRVITEILEWAAVLSIAAIIMLRLYAAIVTQPVLAHDDRHYKALATFFEFQNSTGQAVKEVFLPNSENISRRTIGYQTWLILGLKLLKDHIARDRIYQFVNIIFFAVQMFCVYLMSLWASRRKWFAVSFTALYLTMPIVFGMNRWIVTENFVFPGLWCCSFMMMWVITDEFKGNFSGKADFFVRQVLVPAVAAYGISIFCTFREYAFPYLLTIALTTVFFLCVRRRWTAAAIFALILSPYIVAGWQGSMPVLYWTLGKTGIKSMAMAGIQVDSNVARYYLSLHEWLGRVVFLHCAGPAMSFLIIGGGGFIIGNVWRKTLDLVKSLKNNRIALSNVTKIGADSLFFSIQLFWAVAYVAVVLMSPVRFHRTSVLPIVIVLIAILAGIRLFKDNVWKWEGVIKKSFLGLLFLSWSVMLYQLFIPFEGGQTFLVIPYNMPTFNHPLHLRKLEGFNDWHAIHESEWAAMQKKKENDEKSK